LVLLFSMLLCLLLLPLPHSARLDRTKKCNMGTARVQVSNRMHLLSERVVSMHRCPLECLRGSRTHTRRNSDALERALRTFGMSEQHAVCVHAAIVPGDMAVSRCGNLRGPTFACVRTRANANSLALRARNMQVGIHASAIDELTRSSLRLRRCRRA